MKSRFNVSKKSVSNDVDRMGIFHCSLWFGIGKEIRTHLRLEHTVIVYVQCLLTDLWTVVSRLKMH